MVKRVLVNPEGKLKLELRPPFAYLKDIWDEVRPIEDEDASQTKTSIFVGAGLCSDWLSACVPDESVIEHQTLPVSTIEFLQSIAFPQQKAIARLSNG